LQRRSAVLPGFAGLKAGSGAAIKPFFEQIPAEKFTGSAITKNYGWYCSSAGLPSFRPMAVI
jgi:hypothetical protein